MWWWGDHRGRSPAVAAVRSYHVLTMNVAANRRLWSRQALDTKTQEAELRYYGASCTELVRIEGSKGYFFEAEELEARRVGRHLYAVQWRSAALGSRTSRAWCSWMRRS